MKKPFVFLAFALACRLACAEISYIEIESCKDLPTITLKKIEDVELLIREYSVSVGFLCGDKLLIIANNTYFAMNMNGFKSISDYKAASAKFKNGGDYYDCLAKGLENETLYYFYAGNKFSSVQDCKDAYKKGFYDAGSSAYYLAIKWGLTSYAEYTEYKDVMPKDISYLTYSPNNYFKNKTEYLDSKAKNFSSASTYHAAIGKHYPNNEEYQKALSCGLQDVDYEYFSSFSTFMDEIAKLEKNKNLTREKAFIYYFVSTCIPKGDYSFDVFHSTINTEIRKYNSKLVNALNKFLSNGDFYYLFQNNKLKEFIVSADVKPLGKYNEKSGIFTKSAAASADKLEKFTTYSAAKQ